MSYLFSAYAAVWILLFFYILSLSSRQRKLDREMETLRKLVEKKSP